MSCLGALVWCQPDKGGRWGTLTSTTMAGFTEIHLVAGLLVADFGSGQQKPLGREEHLVTTSGQHRQLTSNNKSSFDLGVAWRRCCCLLLLLLFCLCVQVRQKATWYAH